LEEKKQLAGRTNSKTARHTLIGHTEAYSNRFISGRKNIKISHLMVNRTFMEKPSPPKYKYLDLTKKVYRYEQTVRN
jgi:hypothetical protein